MRRRQRAGTEQRRRSGTALRAAVGRPAAQRPDPAEKRSQLEDAELGQVAGRVRLERIEPVPLRRGHYCVETGAQFARAVDGRAARVGERAGNGAGLRGLDELLHRAQLDLGCAEHDTFLAPRLDVDVAAAA